MENDIMKIRGPFLKGIIGHVIMKALKKAGYDVEVSLYSVDAKSDDVNITVRADIELKTTTENLAKLVKVKE